jgi:diguanylate cyclase (GGDEF)-like protein
VVAPILLLGGVVAISAIVVLPELPTWLTWVPRWLLVALGAVSTVLGTVWLQPWVARRQAAAERERLAVEQLRVHLGRQESFPRLGDRSADALALRVHATVPLHQMNQAENAFGRRSREDGHVGSTVDSGDLDRDLPLFVERQPVGTQVRDWMKHAATSSGFLILVGDSSVGKTRLLYEAAKEVLGDFAVLAPDLGNGDLVNKVAEATFQLPRLIIWLDELQRFVTGPYQSSSDTAITAATIRRLLDAPAPIVILGTLWREHATELRAGDDGDAERPARPKYPNTVDILTDRRLTELSLRGFSRAERQATVKRAADDPRLQRAIADRDYNVTEFLAGARELDRRYDQATREQQAVIHAAVDARRVGIQAPLTPKLLCAAARGYLTTVHPDDTWFPPVLEELASHSRPQDRATAPIPELPNADHTTVLGHGVAEYLLQRLNRQRRNTEPTDTTWRAFIEHTTDPGDLYRLVDSARDRRLLEHVRQLPLRLNDPELHPVQLSQRQGEHPQIVEVDPLTGLSNRMALTEELKSHVAQAHTGALLLLDLDNFRDINDLHGHAAGDAVMRAVAKMLSEHVSAGQVLGRVGGDEFAVLLPGATESEAVAAANRLRKAVAETLTAHGAETGHLTASVGVAIFDSQTSWQAVLANADMALYAAKDAGRDRVMVYEQSHYMDAALRIAMLDRLRTALTQGNLALHAIPMVKLSNRRVVSHELLLRLDDGRQPQFRPEEFLPAAEQSDLILAIDTWVVGVAIDTLVTHPSPELRLDVNLSGRTLDNEDFRSFVTDRLTTAGIAPGRLGFDITATTAVVNLDTARELTQQLRAHGCRITLEEFGAGHSSFTHLKQLPVTGLKISGQFVHGIDYGSRDTVLVQGIVDIARGLGLAIAAKWVERASQADALARLGIRTAQGFHLGQPIPLANLLDQGSPDSFMRRSSTARQWTTQD